MKQRIIDLSYGLTESMVVYPGNKRPVYEWMQRDNSEGCNVTYLRIVVHTGTHVDSPLHFITAGEPIDAVELERLYGKTRLFTYQRQPEARPMYIEDITSQPEEVIENSIFVLRTGIEDFGDTAQYNTCYPYPSEELIDFLIEKRIRAYMTDATSIDRLDSIDNPNHHKILGAGIPVVENLCNLQQLQGISSFIISALPIKLVGREGAPCRAIAILE